MDGNEKTPLVLFATRHVRMYRYFEAFIATHLERLDAECMNFYAELGNPIREQGENVFPRDDNLVEIIRGAMKESVTHPDLIIIGTLGGETCLYHDGIAGIPMGFVPYGRDYEAFAEAILQLICK